MTVKRVMEHDGAWNMAHRKKDNPTEWTAHRDVKEKATALRWLMTEGWEEDANLLAASIESDLARSAG